jgi:hypothetical protein
LVTVAGFQPLSGQSSNSYYQVDIDARPGEFQCPGDLDIDLSDLAQLLGHYGESGAAYEDGALDDDGDVDLSDLAAPLGVYRTVCE